MQACTNFLAGHMLRSKSHYSALDETAIMGAACRHECPTPCFFSLKHGERSVLCCMCVDDMCVCVCVRCVYVCQVGLIRGESQPNPMEGE